MLSIKVKHDHKGGTIHLSQHAYIDSILRHYGLNGLKLLSMPMDTQVHLSTKQAPASTADFALMHDMPYHEAVGTLNWAALAT
jgi:hypothetical protein